MSDTPRCLDCNRPLDRVDHYGIEHTILHNDVYREVAIADGDATGGDFGVASEIDLRCAYCGFSIPQQQREYFYKRWIEVQRATASLEGNERDAQ